MPASVVGGTHNDGVRLDYSLLTLTVSPTRAREDGLSEFLRACNCLASVVGETHNDVVRIAYCLLNLVLTLTKAKTYCNK